jgi:enamine deaminase RidA (YjgF/YER057c/UK114 family)
MITLYAFGPGFGMPDPSPFVTKAEVLLKMAGLAYRTDTTGFRKAPKGKLPYIDDNGQRIADSTFIRWHLERKYQVDFDKGVSAEQRAIGWAFEKMAEDNLYWALVDARWFDEDNFAKGPLNFFRSIPAPMRPLIIAFVRRQLRRALHGHGMGRHTRADVAGQCRYAYDKIKRLLAAHGATMNDVVKVVTYVTDVRSLPEVGKCRTEALEGAPQPVHTFLNINQLAWPGMLVEVDVIAITKAQ